MPTASYAEIFESLKKSIKSLPKEHGHILQLYYIESLNWKEICLVMQISFEKSQALYWQAMDALRPKLELPK